MYPAATSPTAVLDAGFGSGSPMYGGVPLSMSTMQPGSPFGIGGSQQLPQVAQRASMPGPQITSVPGPPPPPMAALTMFQSAPLAADMFSATQATGTLNAYATGPLPAYATGPSPAYGTNPSPAPTPFGTILSATTAPPPAMPAAGLAATHIAMPAAGPPAIDVDPDATSVDGRNPSLVDDGVANPFQDPPQGDQGDLVDFLCHHAQQEDNLTEGVAGIKEDFGLTGHAFTDMMVAIGGHIKKGLDAVEFHDEVESLPPELPYGMTAEKHEEYKVQLEVLKKAEKPNAHKKELRHVENVHQHVEHAKAGQLEKNLLYIREDQLQRRMNMLEQIAAAAPNRPREAKQTQVEALPQELGVRSPFMDKFLPVPLGGGENWHYFNHHQGYYIDKTKIAQREAQLKHQDACHKNEFVFRLAGKQMQDIPEDYWSRDYKAWLKSQGEQMQSEMMEQAATPLGQQADEFGYTRNTTTALMASPDQLKQMTGSGASMMPSGGMNPFGTGMMPSAGLNSMPPSGMNPYGSGMMPSAGMNSMPSGGMNPYGSGMMPSMNGMPSGGMNPYGSVMMPSAGMNGNVPSMMSAGNPFGSPLMTRMY